MIVSPPQCPYRHHHASGWPPRFYESQVSNTKIQVHFVRTCWCQRLRHSCRGKKNHPRAPLHHSSNVLVWVGLGNRVCTTLSNFKRNSLFHQFWWFLWQSCDYRWPTSYRSIWIREGKLTNQHFFGIMSPQCLLETWKPNKKVTCWVNMMQEYSPSMGKQSQGSLENDAVKETIRQWFGISLTWTKTFFSNDQTRQEHRNSKHFTSESTSKHRRSLNSKIKDPTWSNTPMSKVDNTWGFSGIFIEKAFLHLGATTHHHPNKQFTPPPLPHISQRNPSR